MDERRVWRSSHGAPISFDLIVPFSNEEADALPSLIESVRQQICQTWTLTLVPMDTTPSEVSIPRDDRIRTLSLGTNVSRSEAIRLGVENSSADFVTIPPPHVRLESDLLVWATLYLRNSPQTKWFYFDHIEQGNSDQPICKPSFSRELLYSAMFTGPLNLASRQKVQAAIELGELESSVEHYDLLLRLSELIDAVQITRIPEFGYTVNALKQPTQPSNRIASLLEHHYTKRGVRARVQLKCRINSIYQTHFDCPPDADEVTVIIPTKNQAWRMEKCLESLRATTDYGNYQIVVINNQSDEPELFELFRKEEDKGRFRVHDFDEPFNYARMHNVLIRQLTSQYVLLLNNDVYDFSKGWIEQLVATQRMSDDIACVGCLLRFPDGTTQHGGVSFGIGKPCRHAHLGLESDAPGYCGRLQSAQQLSAVTAALLLIDRERYHEVGGFDEINFPISYNDTDLCLKFLQAGYRSIYNPAVTALHEESVSRGKSPMEKVWRKAFEQKWGALIESDRFYNPHLSRHSYVAEPFLTSTWQSKKKISLSEYHRRAATSNIKTAFQDASISREDERCLITKYTS